MTSEIKCPICGGNTTRRLAKKGPDAGKQFYVCTRYPDCRGKVDINIKDTSTLVSDETQYMEHVDRLTKNDLISDPSIVVSLRSGQINIGSNDEVTLHCIDASGNVCSIIVPRVAYNKADEIANNLSIRFSISATVACKSILTKNPYLITALIPQEQLELTASFGDMVERYIEIPPKMRIHVKQYLASFLIVRSDRSGPLQVGLCRVGKNPQKAELYTRSRLNRTRVNIFHTCLSDTQPKPYSLSDRYAAKARAINPFRA